MKKDVKIERSCSSYLLFQVFPSKGRQHALVTRRYSVILALLWLPFLVASSLELLIFGGFKSELALILHVSFDVWFYFITCVVSSNFWTLEQLIDCLLVCVEDIIITNMGQVVSPEIYSTFSMDGSYLRKLVGHLIIRSFTVDGVMSCNILALK